jgi:hypothetical protein
VISPDRRAGYSRGRIPRTPDRASRAYSSDHPLSCNLLEFAKFPGKRQASAKAAVGPSWVRYSGRGHRKQTRGSRGTAGALLRCGEPLAGVWGLSMAPLRLTDEQLTIVMDGARPLRLGDRDPFLLLVAEQLQGLPVVGSADVRRAVQSAQRQYWDPPQLDNQPGHRAVMRAR